MNNPKSEKTKMNIRATAKKAWDKLTYPPFWKEYGYLSICFFVPFLLIFLMYIARGEHPFGDNCVLVLDLNGQYVWFFEALRNFVRGDADLLYSFARQLGGEFLGIYAYYLASPLSFFVSLFPKDKMLEALLALFALKGGLCGLTFGIYMHKTAKKPNRMAIIIFSLCYALCAYGIIQQHNTMWIDAVMWLPLITLGIENLIKYGKFKLYVISLAIAVFSNYYIGYMICIYCAIYFCVYYFANAEKFRNNPMQERVHFLRSLGRMAGYSLLAIGIAAVIILGAYYSLNFGKTTFSDPFASSSWESFGLKFDLIDFLYKLLPGSYDTVRPEGLPFVYCGMLTLLLIPSYFLSKQYSTREKIFSFVLLLALFASFSFNIIDLAWHGFQKPNWLNYRYSFMFSFYLCVLACRAMSDFENLSLRVTMGTGGLIALFCVILQAHQSTNKYIDPDDLGCIYFSLIMIFVYLTALSVAKKRNHAQVASFALVCIVILELFVNGLLGINGLVMDVGASTYSRYNNFLKKMRPVVENVQMQDDSFYRMEKTFYRSNNDNMALMMRGLSGSTSTLNKETVRFLNSMGYASKAHWTKYLGNTPVTDSLLGIKYLISDQTLYSTYYETFATDKMSGYITYRNPYALSLGYGVSDDLLEFELGFVETEDENKADTNGEKKDGEGVKNTIDSLKGMINDFMGIEENNASVYVDNFKNPFDRLNAILGAMLGEDEPVEVFLPVYSEITMLNVEKKNYGQNEVGYKPSPSNITNAALTMKTEALPASGEIFFYAPTDYPREVELSLRVNGEESVSKGTFNGNDTTRIISLGLMEKDDELSLKLTLTKSDYYIKNGADCFWYIDMEVFEDVMARLAENQFQIEEYTEHSFDGTYTASRANDLVLTTLAYDNGWEVWVDGEQVEIEKALGALISFHVGGEAGETHDILIVYNPKTINVGLIISLVSICVFILLIVLDWRFGLGCKRRDGVEYEEAMIEGESEETVVAEITPAIDAAKKEERKRKKNAILADLKLIFFPKKAEKKVHSHHKKKKKK